MSFSTAECMEARSGSGMPKDGDLGVENIKKSKRDDPDKRRFDQDTDTRYWLAIWVAVVSTLWLSFVACFVCFCKFKMTSEVMIALLCTSTANILGLPYIVLHGLFDKEK